MGIKAAPVLKEARAVREPLAVRDRPGERAARGVKVPKDSKAVPEPGLRGRKAHRAVKAASV